MRPFRAVLLLLLLLLATALTGGLTIADPGWRLPDRWNPFAPLRIDEPPGVFVRFKLARLKAEPARCLAALATSNFRFKSVPDGSRAPGCGFENAVRIERTSLALSSPFTLSCPAAVSLALWEIDVVQPAAERHFGQPVVRLEHVGSYACRNIDGHTNAPRSEHATANAIDVSGFVLKSGARIAIGTRWKGSASGAGSADADGALFLHEARDGACRFFNTVLSPDHNAEHASHLHLDRGPYRTCD